MEEAPKTTLQSREYYLSKAAEAEQKAAGVNDLEARRTWLNIARSWRTLADQVAAPPKR